MLQKSNQIPIKAPFLPPAPPSRNVLPLTNALTHFLNSTSQILNTSFLLKKSVSKITSLTSSGLFFSDLRKLLQSHRRHYTTVFTCWVVLHVTCKLISMCKIGGVPKQFKMTSQQLHYFAQNSKILWTQNVQTNCFGLCFLRFCLSWAFAAVKVTDI